MLSTTSPARVLDAAPTAKTALAAAPKSLALNGVSKRFGATTALQPTTLDVQAGELVSLLGPSGCGKTTTLRLVAGFEYPDSGQVLIGGKDVSHLPANKRGLGMVFQSYSLFPHMSVADNIGYGLRMAGVARTERDTAVQRMLDMVRLKDYGSRHISQLSGGQQQRIALARAIVTNPCVLLLDEPLGALDKSLREGMQFEIRQLQQRLGITSLMVTHDQDEAMTMSDRIVVMSHGRILQSGAPAEVYERPRNRFVAEFLGTANIFGCQRTGDAMACFVDAPQVAPFALPALAQAAVHGKTFELAIRPEKILLGSEGTNLVHLAGVVRECVYRGSQHVYRIELKDFAGATIFAYRQAASGIERQAGGSAVRVSFDPSDLVVLEADEGGRA